MKKILSMAFIAMMVAFAAVSCSKDNDSTKKDDPTPVTPPAYDTITKNPIYDMFSIGKDMLGNTRSNFYQHLTSKGFTEAVPGSGSTCSVYLYQTNNYGVQTTDSVNSQGKIYYISMTIVPVNYKQDNSYVPMLTLDYAKNAINRISSQFNMGSCNLRFWGTYNESGYRWFETISDLVTNCTDAKFNKTTSIWIDSSLSHYDATDWNAFIGFQLRAIAPDVQITSAIEYSYPICFVDNRIKD